MKVVSQPHGVKFDLPLNHLLFLVCGVASLLVGCSEAKVEFGERQLLHRRQGAKQSLISDFTGNGNNDILLSDGTLIIGGGTGGHIGSNLTTGSNFSALFLDGKAEDLDRDGRADLVSSSVSIREIRWRKNLGFGKSADSLQFEESEVLINPVRDTLRAKPVYKRFGREDTSSKDTLAVADFAFIDLTGNGQREIVTMSYVSQFEYDIMETKDYRLGLHRQVGSGKNLEYSNREHTLVLFDSSRHTQPPVQKAKLEAKDLNGDGTTDLLLRDKWYENQPDREKSLKERTFPEETPKNPKFRVFGDLNGSGRKDLVFTSTGSIFYAINRGNQKSGSTWGPIRTITDEAYPRRIPHLADLDDDGALDLVTVSTRSQDVWPATWAFNDNEVAWYPNISSQAGRRESAVRWGEKRIINDPNPNAWTDGRAFVGVGDLSSQNISGLLNTALGIVSVSQVYVRSIFQTVEHGDIRGGEDLTTLDWDGDGDSDVVVFTPDGVVGYENLR
jgi:hypothetical protein